MKRLNTALGLLVATPMVIGLGVATAQAQPADQARPAGEAVADDQQAPAPERMTPRDREAALERCIVQKRADHERRRQAAEGDLPRDAASKPFFRHWFRSTPKEECHKQPH